jgi:ABC-2 type transport system ATP-binding protein
LIAALASDVELYILDEPTSGLDPLMEAVFRECVTDLSRVGKSVLLSSHILAEVEALCDQVSIIREGQIVEAGTLSELRHLTRTALSVETDLPIERLAEVPGVYNVQVTGTRAQFDVDSSEFDGILQHLTQYRVRSLISAPPTLEELFMRHYGESATAGGDKR